MSKKQAKDRRSRRSTRIKACELATQLMSGSALLSGDVRKLFSLAIFFENYIDEGARATERDMKLLSRKKVKRFKVVAGGNI